MDVEMKIRGLVMDPASNMPIVNGDASKRSVYNGRTGTTIPKPTMSMNTVRNRICNADADPSRLNCRLSDFIIRDGQPYQTAPAQPLHLAVPHLIFFIDR